ncbi:putative oxidoreductase [Mycobacteroides abscessus subsp. abscessus]|nr:putative oxidoreductase [Mycobacteroides abscessus subsp. abscessus]
MHIIPRAEDELVHLFGELTGDSIDKFAQCAWRDGPHGVPILERSAAWFVGEILARVTLGDHIGHVLLPVAVSRSRELGRYVSFSDVRGLTPGHEA